jgi:signal peptidase I
MAETKRKRGGLTTFVFVLLGVVLLLVFVPVGPGVRTYRQPSGSMQPTLFPGDYLVVTKWTYGYGRYSFAPFPFPMEQGRLLGRAPQRGELAVFRPHPEPDRDFVKRVIGLPGDRIQMIEGVLHINGEAVSREALGEISFDDGSGETVSGEGYRETLPGGAAYVILDRTPNGELDNTRVYTVPAGHYFLMGDDRDNSADSRIPSVVGYVPLENFIGPVSSVIPASGAESLPQKQ